MWEGFLSFLEKGLKIHGVQGRHVGGGRSGFRPVLVENCVVFHSGATPRWPACF